MPSAERHLAAIMFTDIVGFTRIAQARESLALELLEEHRSELRPLFPAHGGTEIKTIGDSFLVEFRSALEAVLCAVEIQRKMEQRNSKVPPERRLQVRVGVHLGDIVHGYGDVYGDAVNVASRIEPLAEPGGVCISQQVYDNIRNKTKLGIVKMGEVELKNVELPVGVYRVSLESSGGIDQGTRFPRERLAVLPFVNISPDPNDEYFADGLTEEMIAKLSEVQGLKVIARTSVMNYKKKEKKVADIGRELGVGSIVEGSVRKAGSKIRVTVQLIDARTEEHVWASNYDKELDDIFAIQSDIASNVAKSVSSQVFPKEQQNDTDDVEAYTFYIRGMQLYHERSQQSLWEALELFTKAVSRDPGFVRAHAALADNWVALAIQGYENFSVVTDKAEVAAKKAVGLGPEVAEAHAAMAEVAWVLDRFQECISEVKRAVELNPNLADSYLSMSTVLMSMGELHEGLKACEKAYELDPLSTRTMIQLTIFYRSAGRPDDAMAILRKLMQLNPRATRTQQAFVEHYIWTGDYAKAEDYLRKALELGPDEPTVRIGQGVIYAMTGRRKEAGQIVQEFRTEKKESVRIYALLFISAALGDLDEAFRNLMRAAELHSWPYHIKYVPLFSDLRKDSRYAQFEAKVGLPS